MIGPSQPFYRIEGMTDPTTGRVEVDFTPSKVTIVSTKLIHGIIKSTLEEVEVDLIPSKATYGQVEVSLIPSKVTIERVKLTSVMIL